jgi:hypothetical protein
LANLDALRYVRTGVSQGWSANRAYRHYSSEAHSNDLTALRRQDFLRLYSETRALRGQAAEAIGQPRGEIPTTIQPRGTRFTSGYGQWVHIYQRPSGETDLLHKVFLVKSNNPITPEEAEAQALQWAREGESQYNYVTLGVGYMGTEQFIPGLGSRQ